MRATRALITIAVLSFLLGAAPVLALDPSLDISQYSHTSWTARDGFSVGAIFAIAQTPDGYLWLGTENGLFRFDGVRTVPWQPPAGQHLTSAPYSLIVTRDGTLWIGTFTGLASWNGNKLTEYPEVGPAFVTSLLEDREGTVWAGIMGGTSDTPGGRLCAIRSGRSECYLQGGAFGIFVWSLYEDGSGELWAAAASGLWRWKPGPPQRYPMPAMRIDDLGKTDDGRVLVAIHEAGLKHIVGDRVVTFPIRSAVNPNAALPDRDVNSNKLLRDRDGGLWIGTHERGLIHVHQGRTEVFTKADGLSGDISCSLFEDREGNIWVGTSSGLDRFRDLPVTTISLKQGLSDVDSNSVLAATDGSIWVATHHGLARWKDGKATIFRKANGLPDDSIQSLFQDDRGRIWVSTVHGLVYLKDGRFAAVNGVPSPEVFSITGDKSDNLWLSGNKGLSHMRNGRLVEHFPWSAMGRHQQAKAVISDKGGVWLAFWTGGGVLYFKDGQVRASYTAADGLGRGPVGGLRLDRDGALWAAIQEKGGLSRMKDGHVATLTTRNGLPCDTIHWSIEDDDRSLWLYTACGLVRITRSELDAWIADPTHRIETTVWDADDGVRVAAVAPASFGPPVAKSTDGRLWFHSGEGIEVVDPRHVAFNKLPPPVHIEQIVADNKTYWQNLLGGPVPKLRLPPRIRDLEFDYVGLSLVAPEKMQFRVKLEGQDKDWRVPVNSRHAHYTNLAPGPYRFRVIASNNSGVWNEQGDTLEFSVDPAYYQTNWFRVLCALAFLALLWTAYQYRVQRLRHDFEMTLDARVGERTRIARELHDTLLQHFQGLLPRFQAAIYKLPEGAVEARKTLEAAVDQASQAITEGRDAVQGLRLTTVEKNDLAMAIRTIGEELATANHSAPKFEVVAEGSPRNLHPILRDEVYCIAAEALRNAFRHAQARQIEVEIGYGEKEFTLHVRDDGRGIDGEVLSGQGREGHFGLNGMQERAKLAGGKLAIWSELASGTEVELSIPAARAYTRSPRRSWIFRKPSDKDSDVREKSNT